MYTYRVEDGRKIVDEDYSVYVVSDHKGEYVTWFAYVYDARHYCDMMNRRLKNDAAKR